MRRRRGTSALLRVVPLALAMALISGLAPEARPASIRPRLAYLDGASLRTVAPTNARSPAVTEAASGTSTRTVNVGAYEATGTTRSIAAPSASHEAAPGPLLAVATGLFETGGIYTLHSDGSDVRKISVGVPQASYPAWSPDGRYLAFNGYGGESGSGIYRTDRDGSGLRRLTSRGYNPDWAPDGSRIVFTLYDPNSDQTDIATMRSDGTGLVRLTSSSLLNEKAPRWSPRGDWIAYSGGGSHLRVIRPDGTGARRVSPLGRAVAGLAAWSPDGSSLAFVTHAAPAIGSFLYVVEADGGKARKVSEATAFEDQLASWAPDGGWIAFIGPDLFISVIRPDGTGSRTITKRQAEGDGIHTHPVWSPDGDEVAHIRLEPAGRAVWVEPLGGDAARRIAVFDDQPATSLAWEQHG